MPVLDIVSRLAAGSPGYRFGWLLVMAGAAEVKHDQHDSSRSDGGG
jgi:hypothetical protein